MIIMENRTSRFLEMFSYGKKQKETKVEIVFTLRDTHVPRSKRRIAVVLSGRLLFLFHVLQEIHGLFYGRKKTQKQ